MPAPQGPFRNLNEQMIHANGVDLCIETFGAPDDPAILLIGGAAASMDWWEDDFCEQLAAGGRYVIRYDTRDTGRSTSLSRGPARLHRLDLTADAVGAARRTRRRQAHVVGISMGGGIAQRLALDHPDRVPASRCISTSPGGPAGPANPTCRRCRPERGGLRRPGADPDWDDRAAVIEDIVDSERLFSGRYGVDEPRVRAVAGRVFDRTDRLRGQPDQPLDPGGGDDRCARSATITAPTLVLHGTDDPLFPYGHGEALAREIPGARLMALREGRAPDAAAAGLGRRRAAILNHTARAS